MVDRAVKTNLVEAIEAGDIRRLEVVLTQHPEALRATIAGGTALHFAAACGHVGVMETLIMQGLDVHAVEANTFDTPLHKACSEGHVDAARWLIERGSDVNAGVSNDWPTPLINPARKGHLEVAQLLVDHGADVNASYFAKSWGVRRNAMDFALAHGHEAMVKYLIEHGAKPSEPA